MLSDRHDPLLLPLAPDLELIGDEIHVLLVQARELAQPDPGRVEQLEHREVPRLPEAAGRRPPLRVVEQEIDLDPLEVEGEPALELGRARRLRGIHFHAARRVEKAIEGAQRRQGAGRGALGQPALLLRAQPRPDRLPVHARPAPRVAIVAAAERHEVAEVATVRFHGVGRVVALLGEELEERPDLRAGHETLPRAAGPGSAAQGCGPGAAGPAAGPGAADPGATPRGIPIRSANRSISAIARSANISLFFCLSFTGRSSGSTSPKLAFIGWKCSGSAECTYRYSAPSIVVGGGTRGASPASRRARLIPARIPVAADSV